MREKSDNKFVSASLFFIFNKIGIWSVRGACPGLLIVIQSTERPWCLNLQSVVDDLLTLDLALPNNWEQSK
jgi:hypothetical protein